MSSYTQGTGFGIIAHPLFKMQAIGVDPDNSTDLANQPLPFMYSWTLLSPGGLPPNSTLAAVLYSAAAIQRGVVTFGSNTLQVSHSRFGC